MGIRRINADKYAKGLVLSHNVASEPALRSFCQRTGLSMLGVTDVEIDVIHSALGISAVVSAAMKAGGGGGGVAVTVEQVGLPLNMHKWGFVIL